MRIDVQMYIPYSKHHTMPVFFNYLTFQEIFITVNFMFCIDLEDVLKLYLIKNYPDHNIILLITKKV
jgi:hypothetical protein